VISRRRIKIKRIFYEPDLVPIYEGYFYHKYRHCIGVNLEIEGLKQEFRNVTTKLEFI